MSSKQPKRLEYVICLSLASSSKSFLQAGLHPATKLFIYDSIASIKVLEYIDMDCLIPLIDCF